MRLMDKLSENARGAPFADRCFLKEWKHVQSGAGCLSGHCRINLAGSVRAMARILKIAVQVALLCSERLPPLNRLLESLHPFRRNFFNFSSPRITSFLGMNRIRITPQANNLGFVREPERVKVVIARTEFFEQKM